MDIIKKLRENLGAGLMDCKKALEEANGNYDDAVKILRERGIAKAEKKSDRVASEGFVGYKLENNLVTFAEVNCETDFVSRNINFCQLCKDVINKIHAKEDFSSLITEAVIKMGENLKIGNSAQVSLNQENIAIYIHGQSEHDSELGRIVSAVIYKNTNPNSGHQDFAKKIAMHVAATSPLGLVESDISNDIIEREKEIYLTQIKESGKPEEIAQKMLIGKVRKFYEENLLLEQIFVIDNKTKIKDAIANFNKSQQDTLEVVKFIRFEVGII